MVYEVSLYDMRPKSFCLIDKSYWKRDTPYTGPTRIYKSYKKGKIVKFIELISN